MEALRQFLQSKMGKLLLILCLSPLALLGIESYFSQPNNPNQIAKVGEIGIDLTSLQNTFNERRADLSKEIGNASLINDQILRDQILQSLIDRALLENQIHQLGMTISDQTITQMIMQEQGLQDDNGQFSQEKFGQFLQNRRITQEQLFANIRKQLAIGELTGNILKTAIFSNAEVDKLINFNTQIRPLWVARIPWQNYFEKVTVSDQDIADFYQKNQQTIKSQEMVDLSYVMLSRKNLNVAAPTDEEIQQFYQTYVENVKKATSSEFATILLTGEDAKTKIADLKQQLDNHADFAQLAKQHSQETGSRENGGVIGEITAVMFPESYQQVHDKIQGLSEGEVSEPILTEYGYQLFKLVKRTSETPKSLDDIKDELIAKINQQKYENIYKDLINKINNSAADGASIDEIASQYQLTSHIIKDYPKENNQTALHWPAVVNGAFDDLALQNNGVSVGIEIDNNQIVWIHATNHRPVKSLSLEEAKPQLLEKIKVEKAKQMALAEAKMYADKVKQTNQLDNIGISFQALGHVSRQVMGLLNEERSVAFSQPATDDQLAVMTQETHQGASIIVGGKIENQQISKITDHDKRQTAQVIRDNIGQSELEDYIAYLHGQTKVEINQKNLNSH